MALSKNSIKHLRSLRLKKGRQAHGTFVLEGDKIVRELLDHRPGEVVQIYATDSWIETWQHRYPLFADRILAVTPRELQDASAMTTPNQVLAEAHIPRLDANWQDLGSQFAFFLDGIQDPGNAGTILRVADWFGFPTVVFGPGSVDPWHPKTVQAAMGAVLRIRILTADLPDILSQIPHLPVYGATLEGESLFNQSFSEPGLIIIGNESRGLRPEIASMVTRFLHIPAGPRAQTGAESLNAGVAAGIIGAFIVQRHFRLL
jgi:TrmH family RNA methyltransferase